MFYIYEQVYFLLGTVILYENIVSGLTFVLYTTFFPLFASHVIFRAEYKSTREKDTPLSWSWSQQWTIKKKKKSSKSQQNLLAIFALAFCIAKKFDSSHFWCKNNEKRFNVHFVVNFQQKLLPSRLPNWISWSFFSVHCGN